jgi:predicted nucleotidyltransferase
MNLFERVADAQEREGLRVLVIGGHAVNAYGYTRTTLDVDFLVTVESFPEWRAVFESAGYRCAGQTETFARMDPPVTDPPSLPVDVMLVSSETFSKLNSERQLLDFGGLSLPVPKPLNLIALKLHAMRHPERFKKGKDLPDILNLISICQIDTNSREFVDIINRYASDETRSLLDSHLS